MKKYFYLILLLIFSFCSNDESNTIDYAKSLVGDYKLMSMESNIAVDLNLDSFAQKDLIEEIDCIYHDSFEFFHIAIRTNGNSRFLQYNVVHSYSVRYEQSPYSYQCFSSESMSYNFDYDERKILEITHRDFVSERENEYGKLLAIDYVESEKEITTKIEKEIYTAEGWKTIIITSVYKNIYDDNFAP